MTMRQAVVPGYYLVCYNSIIDFAIEFNAVVPGYYLVCYNYEQTGLSPHEAVVPGYYLVCYNIYLADLHRGAL